MTKKVLITGGTGLIGTALSKYLSERGYEIHILSRQKRSDSKFKYFTWDINAQFIEEGALDVDVIIHLAGAGIADSRWSDKRKAKILSSRIVSTKLIKQYLERMNGPKPFYIGASAIGIYGNNDKACIERDVSNQDSFLVHVVKQWEKAHEEMINLTSKFKMIRIGIVLSKKGGVLAQLLIPFKFRIGTYFGKGNQIMPWIHVSDICKMFEFLIENGENGIYNGVAPKPVNGKSMVRTIAKVKKGPFILFGIPEFILKIIFGEMSETILSSTNVSSDKILSKGFVFEFTTIKEAMLNLLS